MAGFNLAQWCLEASIRSLGRDLGRNLTRKPALVMVEAELQIVTWTYGELAERIGWIMNRLERLRLPRHSCVVIQLPQGFDFAVSLMAVIGGGWVAVPLSPLLSLRETAEIMAQVNPAVILDTAFLESALASAASASEIHWAETEPEDPCLLLFTSGTGASPKGVLHAQRMVLGREPMRQAWTGIGSSDVVFHSGQLNWTYTMGVGLFDTWRVGATAVLSEKILEPQEWLSVVEKVGATILAGVPTLYRRILKHDHPEKKNLSRLRHVLSAGEPLSAALEAQWRTRSGKPIYEALGMTEISTYISSGPSVAVRSGSPGKPQPGRRVEILPIEGGETPLAAGEVGLLAVHRSDPGLMLGYFGPHSGDASVFRGEWFVGGDLARIDTDGYVWFEGRNDEVMKISGYRISPLEVESVIAGHPAVAEVGCAAVSPVEGGEILAAFVVLKDGSAVESHDILQWTESRLSVYKRPRQIFIVDHLPRTPNGKLKRRELGAKSGGKIP